MTSRGYYCQSSLALFWSLHVCFPFLPPDTPFYSASFLDSEGVVVENSEMVVLLNTTVTLGILLVEAGALDISRLQGD